MHAQSHDRIKLQYQQYMERRTPDNTYIYIKNQIQLISVGLTHVRPNYTRKQMQSTKFRGYCGWAVAGLQARAHKVDQGRQGFQ